MFLEKSNFHDRAIEKVKSLWHLYILSENPEQLEKEFDLFPESIQMIGTGRHEFYKTKEEFLHGMSVDRMQASDIVFEMQDEWYEVQEISDNVCVVYGNIWAREKNLHGQPFFVDMEGSRFTVVCKNTEHGVEICNIHHSMPHIDQKIDEYYPKTLSSWVKELERRIEQDRMTGLYNRYYMEQHVSQAMNHSDGYFFILDLDNFKQINDTMGHLIGDQVIQEFSGLLRNAFSPNALFGRMGGDEFAVWDTKIASYAEAETRFEKLLTACQTISFKLDSRVSCSAGTAFFVCNSENFSSLYNRTDRALYRAKAIGKARLFWE